MMSQTAIQPIITLADKFTPYIEMLSLPTLHQNALSANFTSKCFLCKPYIEMLSLQTLHRNAFNGP